MGGKKNYIKNRSLKHELYGSLIWLYAKMITPLLILTVIGAGLVIYWQVTTLPFGKIGMAFLTLSMLFVAINAFIMIFQRDDGNHFKGVEVTDEDTPELWKEVRRLSDFANCPPISKLYIDNEFNACASLSKKKGIFGKRELEVTIGLPMMAAMTTEECASVVAHEVGHHHGDDARRYLVLFNTTRRANYIIDMHNSGLWIFCLPTTIVFSLYLAVLYRLSWRFRHQCEYDADRFAAEIFGTEVYGRTEVACELFSDGIHEVLCKPLEDAYIQGRELPKNMFLGLTERFQQVLKTDDFVKNLKTALAQDSHHCSSHPSLKDRLANIGAEPQLPKFDPENIAARDWLGGEYNEIAEVLQEVWADKYTHEWADDFKFQRQLNARAQRIFEETEPVLKEDPNNVEAWFARVAICHHFLDDAACSKLIVEASERFPNVTDFSLSRAELEIAADDPQGVLRLLKLIEYKSSGALQAHQRLKELAQTVDYWRDEFPNLAGVFQAEEFVGIINKLRKPAELAKKEYLKFDPDSKVEAAQLPQWQINAIIDFCDYNDLIERLWLFKCDEGTSAEPSYFLVANYRTNSDHEDCEAFIDFDSLDLPLFGKVTFGGIVFGGDAVEGVFAKAMLPKNVHECIAQTRPIFTANYTKRRLEDIQAEPGEDMLKKSESVAA